jgi:hypothetical protein
LARAPDIWCNDGEERFTAGKQCQRIARAARLSTSLFIPAFTLPVFVF